jgi:hypothetical protein
MPRRYVAHTYNNRRALRIILGTIIGVLVFAVTAFLILFFALEQFLVNTEYGVRLEIPWLMD